MKLAQLTTFTVAMVMTASMAMGQRMKIVDGDLSSLSGVKSFNIEYDYSNMMVGKDSEKDYLDDKKEAYNKKETGKGDKFVEGWVADRKEHFEPKFEELFNKYGEIHIGKNKSDKYTLVFHTTYTDPGYNVGISRRDAFIDAEVTIIETATKKQIAKITLQKSPGEGGMGYDFTNAFRIQESYAKAGKSLVKFIEKNI